MTGRMPGFTAEDALPQRTRNADARGYRFSAHDNAGAALAITAQTLRLPADGSQPCIPGCICVSLDGCPCCPTSDPFPTILRRKY